MERKEPAQMENETLNIHDKDQSTDGGPSFGIALYIVGGVFLIGATILILMLFAGGSVTE